MRGHAVFAAVFMADREEDNFLLRRREAPNAAV
jgi:hypothetical protein